jgi:serine/threonine protein kinase
VKKVIRLGSFELIEPLGRGGMGEVWRGVHLTEGVPVAVKVLQAERAHSSEYVTAFRREAERLAALDHPAIVTIFDFGVLPNSAEDESEGLLVRGSPYLVMELASKGALRTGMKMSWPEVHRLLRILLGALAHAHARSIIHRDIKPGNVLLSGCADGSRDDFLLSDFGIAHVDDLDVDVPEGELVGTPGFMAPEQVRGEWRELGPWTDLYAVGCLAWALLSGEMPFVSDTPTQLFYLQLTRELPPLPDHVECPRGPRAWIERMTRVDPRARFRRAADASNALELALQSAVASPISSPIPSAPKLDPAFAATWVSMSRAPIVSFEAPKHEPLPAFDRVKASFPSSWRTRTHSPRVELDAVGLSLYGARELPLAGRESERDALWVSLEHTYREGGLQVIVLHGASGVGKSRLLRWTMHRAHELGLATTLLATHGPERGPRDGIVPALARYLGCIRLAPDTLRARIQAHLEMHGVAGDPMEVESLFGLLAPFSCTEGAPRGTDRENSMHALRFALEREARQRMVVLGLDDLHWGDESMRALELLADGSFEAPLVVIATVKEEAQGVHPEMRARLCELRNAERTSGIFVGPLRAEDHLRLVRDLLSLEPTLAGDLARRTEGNPLFAEQLVGDWVRRGILEVTRRGFALRADADVALPDDLHAVWLARVELVLAERSTLDREALELAALLGHRIGEDEWHRLCEIASLPSPLALATALSRARLAHRDLDGTLAFVHGALRESILRAARDAGRRDAQMAQIEVLLRELVSRGAEHATERLGRLLAESGRDLEAAETLVRAAEERRRGCDYGMALGLLTEADVCFERGGVSLSDARRASGFIVRAWALRQVGHYSDSLCVAEHVLAQQGVGWGEYVASALLRRADVDVRLGRVDRGRSDLERARDELGVRGDLLGIASAEWMLAWIDVFRGELDSPVTQLGRLCSLAESPSFPPPGPLHLYWTLGFVHVAREEAELGETFCRLAEEAAHRSKNRLGLAHARAVASGVALLRGLDLEAVSLAEDAIAHYRAIGSNEVHFGELALGMALRRLRRLDEADRALNRAAALLEKSGRVGFRLRIDTVRIAVDAASGRYALMREQLADAAEKRAFYSLRETRLARELLTAADIAEEAEHFDIAKAARRLALEHLDKPHTKAEHAKLSERFGLGHF